MPTHSISTDISSDYVLENSVYICRKKGFQPICGREKDRCPLPGTDYSAFWYFWMKAKSPGLLVG
jgi:hypothetical protein